MFLLVLIGNFAYGQAKKASFPQPFSLDGEVFEGLTSLETLRLCVSGYSGLD